LPRAHAEAACGIVGRREHVGKLGLFSPFGFFGTEGDGKRSFGILFARHDLAEKIGQMNGSDAHQPDTLRKTASLGRVHATFRGLVTRPNFSLATRRTREPWAVVSSSTRMAAGSALGRSASDRVRRKTVVGVFSTASDRRRVTFAQASIDSERGCVF